MPVTAKLLPKSFRKARSSRLLPRTFSSILSLHDDPPSVNAPNPALDFEDTRAAYESKSTKDLLRAAACFNLSRIPILVENAEPLLRVSRNLLGGTATDLILKSTLFGHFCAGEDQKGIQPVLKKLDEAGIGSILDYAAESDESPEPALHPNSGEIITPQSREYDYESAKQRCPPFPLPHDKN
jgi:hypothetical protein